MVCIPVRCTFPHRNPQSIDEFRGKSLTSGFVSSDTRQPIRNAEVAMTEHFPELYRMAKSGSGDLRQRPRHSLTGRPRRQVSTGTSPAFGRVARFSVPAEAECNVFLVTTAEITRWLGLGIRSTRFVALGVRAVYSTPRSVRDTSPRNSASCAFSSLNILPTKSINSWTLPKWAAMPDRTCSARPENASPGWISRIWTTNARRIRFQRNRAVPDPN